MKSRRSQVQNLLREDKSLIRKEGSSTSHGFNMTGNQREGRGQGMEIRMLLHLALGTVWVSMSSPLGKQEAALKYSRVHPKESM